MKNYNLPTISQDDIEYALSELRKELQAEGYYDDQIQYINDAFIYNLRQRLKGKAIIRGKLSTITSNEITATRQQIQALEWQLKHDGREKDRKIHQEALENLKVHLNKLKGGKFNNDNY